MKTDNVYSVVVPLNNPMAAWKEIRFLVNAEDSDAAWDQVMTVLDLQHISIGIGTVQRVDPSAVDNPLLTQLHDFDLRRS